jgi:hypothetical protein
MEEIGHLVISSPGAADDYLLVSDIGSVANLTVR